jgi:hypothetical protein
LPLAPAGNARLTLRLYSPRDEILDGRYAFPALEHLEETR